MDWQIEYYKKKNGNIPVLEFLLKLNPKIRVKAYNEIRLLREYGIYLKEPYVKSIKGEKYKGIYELRINQGNDTSRIFYFTYNKNIFIMLNGFIKKTNKTPKAELEKAKKYKIDYEERCKS
ncbi:type II toxin-antitoxin system RelE/ParE family toxin [Clostridium sp. CT7]|uniref:type II toxin-antitoxin system RelE/ParE family toxin n=2 Tax=Clostridium TaxID=1485 RepID=UPI0008244292|nr:MULTISPECIES: type II toxin-antitoxin system RelE/ParE family toxin [Clostridium]PJI10222.1 type II toxin-antitoxin system RelE/ParE family toxin [Clostridium sp. CT7]